MKKSLFLILSTLGLLVSGVSAIRTPFKQAYADDETTTTLEYEDTYDDNNITRTYKNITIGDIEENFKAPAGCVLNITTNSENLGLLKTNVLEHDYFKDKDQFQMLSLSVYRSMGGSKMYADSDTKWSVSTSDFESVVTSIISAIKLYEIDEKISDVDVGASVEISLYTDIGADMSAVFKLVLETAPYHVKKYEPGDLLSLSAYYYRDDNDSEKRVDIRSYYEYTLFNDKYGFKTDGRVKHDYDDDYYEIYLIQYIDKNTNIILDTDDAYDSTPGIEIQNPSEDPLTIYSVITFKQDGVEYKFYSNEITIDNPVKGLLIDGYNNRTSVGKNVTHQLSVNFGFNYEDITSASLNLRLDGGDQEVVNHVILEDGIYYEPTGNEVIFDKITDDFWKFDFTCAEVGEHTLFGELMVLTDKVQFYGAAVTFKINVTEIDTKYTPLDEALTINIPDRVDCIAGGTAIEVEANIASDALNDGETPTFTWEANRNDVINLESDDNKATINVVSGGVVTVTVTCYGSAFGSISKSFILNSISDIYSITTLNIPDEFHYSGQDLTIGLNIDKHSNVINFNPEWSVKDKDGNDVEFVDNKNQTITLTAPTNNDYTITASYNGVEIDSQVVEVRNINVNVFIQQNIWWIVLITLTFMAAVILLKIALDKKGSLVKKVEKTRKDFESIDRNDKEIIKKLNKIRLSILGDIDYARSLNMNALNEYEKTIRYLGKSLADIKDITKNKETMSIQEYEDTYNRLDKDLAKALIVAKEIEDAKELSRQNALKANENNIVKEENNKK